MTMWLFLIIKFHFFQLFDLISFFIYYRSYLHYSVYFINPEVYKKLVDNYFANTFGSKRIFIN